MNKLAFCFVTLGIASLTCAQAAPSRAGQAPSPKGGDDLQSELKQLHRELRDLRALVDQMAKESKPTSRQETRTEAKTETQTEGGTGGPRTRVFTLKDGKPSELRVETGSGDGPGKVWVGRPGQPFVLRTGDTGGFTWSTAPAKTIEVEGQKQDAFKVDLQRAKKDKVKEGKEKDGKARVELKTGTGTCSCCENCPCCQAQKKEGSIALRVAPESGMVRVLDGQHLVSPPRLDMTPMTLTTPRVITLGDRNCTPARGQIQARSLPTVEVAPLPTPAPKKAKAKKDGDDEQPIQKHRLIDV
jgi:hypothetical protein